MDWQTKSKIMKFTDGCTWNELTEAIKTEYFPSLEFDAVKEKVRGYIRRQPEYKKHPNNDTAIDGYSGVEGNKDGTVTYDRIIDICEGEELTPQLLMQKHNLDCTKWQIVSYKNNYWHSQIKGGIRLIMYQSKVVVRPLTENEHTLEYIDEYMSKKQFKYDKPLTKTLQYDAGGEVLEVDIPDLHVGLLSWLKETGADYDIKIAKEYFFKAIYDIVSRCEGRKFKKIIFALLGDLLHIDNDNQTTTKGTIQQADGRVAKIFDNTLDMIIDAVTMMGDIAPVEVIYISGNHDRVLGYTLIKAIQQAFRKDDNITFDTDPNPHKYRLIGKVLIGWCHGDMPKKNISEWLQQEARAEFGQSLFAEVHAGHYHSQSVQEQSGMIIRYLPTICNASYWEHQQGYSKNVKTLMCFIWHEEIGLREMWFNNI